jgi:hypothetical protein
MILFIIKKLKREKNITFLFLFLLFILLGFDHFNTKDNIYINLDEESHNEHQDGESPCGM